MGKHHTFLVPQCTSFASNCSLLLLSRLCHDQETLAITDLLLVQQKRTAFAAGATPFKGTREFGRPIQNEGSPFGQYTQQQQQPQYQVQQPQQLGQNHQLHQEQHGQQHQLGGWEYSGQQLWCRPDDGAAEQAISVSGSHRYALPPLPVQ